MLMLPMTQVIMQLQPTDISAQIAQIAVGRFTYGLMPESCLLWLPTDRIDVGAFCCVAPEARIFGGGEHALDLPSSFPFRTIFRPELGNSDAFAKAPTVIGNDVWLGYRSIVLGGVSIGDGAVVGAGALVTHNVDPYTIVAGNPARPVGRRFGEEIVERLLALRWWDWSEQRIRAFEPYFYADIDTFLAEAEAEDARTSVPSTMQG
jgi:chloramphenicol O-acetyltransferase type B